MKEAEVIIIGAGLAGLSAAIYLGRAKRETLVVDAGKSMAQWEPEVANYLGFPEGIAGDELLRRGRRQAERHRVRFARDEILSARASTRGFSLRGAKGAYTCRRLLLATGIFHIPPDIPGVKPCLGHSLFFCKDCDGYRVQGKRVAVYGWTNEAVEYALGILLYTPHVLVVTDGRATTWDAVHAQWLKEYKVPVFAQTIDNLRHRAGQIRWLEFGDGTQAAIEALFTTRGDIYFNQLAKELKAKVDADGEIEVDAAMRTTVPGLYACGCVTPANCQMIIAAGQGAAAAQAINRELFEASLATRSLRRFRHRQLGRRQRAR